MITLQNITSHEFIGLYAEILRSSNPQVIGLNGRIINETKSMFTINTARGSKCVPKSRSDWGFTVQGSRIVINGDTITKRPFDRIGRRS